MEIKLDIKSLENVGEITEEKLNHFKSVFEALVNSGALVGVRNGCATLHFDAVGTFMGVELKYWPWRNRSNRG